MGYRRLVKYLICFVLAVFFCSSYFAQNVSADDMIRWFVRAGFDDVGVECKNEKNDGEYSCEFEFIAPEKPLEWWSEPPGQISDTKTNLCAKFFYFLRTSASWEDFDTGEIEAILLNADGKLEEESCPTSYYKIARYTFGADRFTERQNYSDSFTVSYDYFKARSIRTESRESFKNTAYICVDAEMALSGNGIIPDSGAQGFHTVCQGPFYLSETKNQFLGAVFMKNVENNDSVTNDNLEIDCSEDACPDVVVNFEMKQDVGLPGTGGTIYRILEQKNGGESVVSNMFGDNFVPVDPGTSWSNITDESRVIRNIKPGDNICYILQYYSIPDGIYKSTGYKKSCVSAKAPSISEVTFNGSVSVGENKKFAKINCDSGSCSAKFDIAIWTIDDSSGEVETDYEISRFFVSKNSKYESSSEEGSTAGKRIKPEEQMVPGDKACYTLRYKGSPRDSYYTAASTACAVAEATMGSSMGLTLRNMNSGTGYRSFGNMVYAKPGDGVDINGWFEPTYQQMAGVFPDEFKILPDYPYFVSDSLVSRSIRGDVTNLYGSGPDQSWNNSFGIKANSDCVRTINGQIGSPNLYKSTVFGNTYVKYSVNVRDVGKSVPVQVVTNECRESRNTPKSVELKWNGNNIDGKFQATIDNDSIQSNYAYIKVPYNFENSTEIVESSDEKVVYAGETKNIEFNYIVKARENEVTAGNYATKVPNAKWRVYIRYGDNDWKLAGGQIENETINSDGNISGGIFPQSFNIGIEDVPAGTTVCAKVAIYPKDSGEYTNTSPKDFSGWVDSDNEVCYTVAKKPSFQVWGGGLYSVGSIETSVSEKTVKDDNGNSVERVFGSWVELGLVADKTVRGLASGASTGYGATGDANTYTSSTLGGGTGDYCKRSPLSFANENCSIGVVGELNMNSNTGSISSDKSALIARFIEDSGYEEMELGDNNEIGYETISGKKFINAKGKDVTIIGDIEYEDGPYDSLDDVPKLIIYAKNIKMLCGAPIFKVDAVLIADEDVNTCDDENENSPNRSIGQLKINGAVIANTLTLNRTYGAATGKNSVIPAEIINYDSSLYSLSNVVTSNSGGTGTLVQAYSRELAPRY